MFLYYEFSLEFLEFSSVYFIFIVLTKKYLLGVQIQTLANYLFSNEQYNIPNVSQLLINKFVHSIVSILTSYAKIRET